MESNQVQKEFVLIYGRLLIAKNPDQHLKNRINFFAAEIWNKTIQQYFCHPNLGA